MSAVALTGGIASGKSSVARLLEQYAIPCLDTDAVAAELSSAGGLAIPALQDAFGVGCLDSSGGLDRRKMRELVFSDAMARGRLEGILHPLIRMRTDAFLADQKDSRCAVAIPLFFEALAYRGRFSHVVVVDCASTIQRRRLIEDRGMEPKLADAIIGAQSRRVIRLQLADRVLVNNSHLSNLAAQVRSWVGGWS